MSDGEGSLLIFEETRIGACYERNYDRLVVDPHMPLFAVIDSECDDGTAGDTVARALLDCRPDLISAQFRGVEAVENVLVAALTGAADALISQRHPGGASVTACSRCGPLGVVAHVGECRLYLRERGAWVKKTSDHTALFDPRGLLPEGLRVPNILTRVIGLSPVAVDTARLALDEGGAVLLCTPGAWHPFDPDHGGAAPPPSYDEHGVAAFVLERYVENGEKDNGTIIVARLAD
jgi:serine/threonine protein phosphatase PrpC